MTFAEYIKDQPLPLELVDRTVNCCLLVFTEEFLDALPDHLKLELLMALSQTGPGTVGYATISALANAVNILNNLGEYACH